MHELSWGICGGVSDVPLWEEQRLLPALPSEPQVGDTETAWPQDMVTAQLAPGRFGKAQPWADVPWGLHAGMFAVP